MPIRTATAEDLPAVLALLDEAGLPAGGVAEALGDFLVESAGDRVRAVAGLERLGDVALLRSVAVSPDERGRGLARRLCERVLAGAAGVDAVYLLTLDAAGWFERLGFERVPRESAPEAVRDCEQFARLCPGTAVLMRRRM